MSSNSESDWRKFVPPDIRDLYEVHNYRHAAEVLSMGCGAEFAELLNALRVFRLRISDIERAGGNESEIPKKLSQLLRPKGWLETRIQGNLEIRLLSRSVEQPTGAGSVHANEDGEEGGFNANTVTRQNFVDGHNIDYLKNRVAFDLEWNSKDQTFDRDLYAFRAFHEYRLISAGVILTRSADLNEVFERLGPIRGEDGSPVLKKKNSKPRLVKEKYGAATTWMGKLIPRLEAGRNGGCPVLALGITRKLIEDYES